jgi:hypothetical protein
MFDVDGQNLKAIASNIKHQTYFSFYLDML